MQSIKLSKLDGDTAKVTLAEDEFGLEQITKSISIVLQSGVSAVPYAIGIEGEWGAGKSTLINFVLEDLASETLLHKSLKFDPWLVGGKSQLLGGLFNALTVAIQEMSYSPTIKEKISSDPKILDELGNRVSRYADTLKRGGDAVDYAAAFDPTGKSVLAATGLKLLAHLANWCAPRTPSLEEMKTNLKGDFQTLANLVPGLRFTVVIDDLDRLEPEESVEILRLVKAVADFPIVTYLVCFDRDTLASHIEQVLGIKGGHSYIEKIFQGFISLPPQEPFALRRFVRKKLAESFPEEFERDPAVVSPNRDREHALFDVWVGALVNTPRTAIRLVEAVKFGWPFLSQRADFVDYIWLQLIKLRSLPLHAWVRDYVVNIGSYRDGGRPGDDEPSREAQKLRDILSAMGWKDKLYRLGLTEFLPGLKNVSFEDGADVFKLEGGELEEFERGCRLGSPSHWRYYFSFDRPSYALENDVLSNFRRVAIGDFQAAAHILRDLLHREHSVKKGYFFEVFLERLFDIRDQLNVEEEVAIFRVFAEVMDEVPPRAGVDFGRSSPWGIAEKLVSPNVGPVFVDVARSAPSINWVCDLIRGLGFSFGMAGADHARPDHQWLTLEQFHAALAVVLDRLRALGISKILELREPLDPLFCWKQLGNEAELKVFLHQAIEDSRVFLKFLEAMRSWVSNSDVGLYRPLRSELIAHFSDPVAVKERLSRIIADVNEPEDIRGWAELLLNEWEDERGGRRASRRKIKTDWQKALRSPPAAPSPR